jgi:uncharacterized protein (TIGR00725 family)
MPAQRKPVIAVIGAGQCSKEQADRAAAVGRYVAEHGGVIVSGGRGGIMEGVCRGAAEAGGVAIGILPSSDKSEANPYVTYAIPTGLGEARNALVVRAADVVIAFPGKYGTLSEMALALKMGKPLISVGAWTLDDTVIQIDDPIEAATKALELADVSR